MDSHVDRLLHLLTLTVLMFGLDQSEFGMWGAKWTQTLVSTSNRFSLLDNEQSFKGQPAPEVDFCSCGYEPEELPDLRTLGIKPRKRKRKQRQVYMEPEGSPVSTNQASPGDCNLWRPYITHVIFYQAKYMVYQCKFCWTLAV